MPTIHCDIREGRTDEQIRRLGEAITDAVHETIGSPRQYIHIIIRETPASHHFLGGRQLLPPD